MKKLLENTVWWTGVLCLGIVLGVTIKIVSAWVEPEAMPPGGNIAAPLNTGNIGQAKQGGLTLNIGGATYGLIVDKGLVGIGVTAPGEKLEVNGNIKLTGDASGNPAYKITNLIAPTGSSDAATKGYVDAAAGGAGGGSSNKIVDISPSDAYTEICFKNGNTYYDGHSGGESTQNGECLPGDLGFIIEKNVSPNTAWSDAKYNCYQKGMRLPEPDEWQYSCRHASSARLNDMPKDLEWTSTYVTPAYLPVYPTLFGIAMGKRWPNWGGNPDCSAMTTLHVASGPGADIDTPDDGRTVGAAKYRCVR
jgi:hypothetical protein